MCPRDDLNPVTRTASCGSHAGVLPRSNVSQYPPADGGACCLHPRLKLWIRRFRRIPREPRSAHPVARANRPAAAHLRRMGPAAAAPPDSGSPAGWRASRYRTTSWRPRPRSCYERRAGPACRRAIGDDGAKCRQAGGTIRAPDAVARFGNTGFTDSTDVCAGSDHQATSTGVCDSSPAGARGNAVIDWHAGAEVGRISAATASSGTANRFGPASPETRRGDGHHQDRELGYARRPYSGQAAGISPTSHPRVGDQTSIGEEFEKLRHTSGFTRPDKLRHANRGD
jgi:hypothetical protein